MTNAVNLASAAGTGFAFRNRIINGDMRIDQRNAGVEVNPAVGSSYYLDRWTAISSAASKFKIGQNAGGVTPPDGFTNYLGCTSTSAYTLGASDAFGIRHIIEGFNVADLGWGTANARPITVSFWVRSSLTGLFGLGLGNNLFSRAYPASYTINSANTWEYKTITIPGDTTGTWLTNSGVGLYLTWQFGYGSSLSGTANTWNAGTAFAPTGAVSIVGTNGATFYLTGVQLEVGSVATPFERRPYGTELALCQRYYQRIVFGNNGYSAAGTNCGGRVSYPVPMRTAPTASANDIGNTTAGTTIIDSISAISLRYYANTTGTSGYEVNVGSNLSAEL